MLAEWLDKWYLHPNLTKQQLLRLAPDKDALRDLIYVCVICIGLVLTWLNTQGSPIPAALLKTTYYFAFGLAALIFALVISFQISTFCKNLILKFSRFLEPELARIFFLVTFIFIDLIKSFPRLFRRKQFHTLTIFMWISYLLSYFFTGAVLYSKNWIESFSVVWLKVFSFRIDARKKRWNCWE